MHSVQRNFAKKQERFKVTRRLYETSDYYDNLVNLLQTVNDNKKRSIAT